MIYNKHMNLADLDIERREAIQAGRKAKHSLEKALSYINDAKNWGFFDMLGGGMISSVLKRSKMQDAKKYMEQAKFELELFSEELEDVGSEFDIDLDVDNFLGIADIVFDNIFVDFMVQQKIDKAKQSIEDLIYEIDQILYSLENY